jgi:hypothetical protein
MTVRVTDDGDQHAVIRRAGEISAGNGRMDATGDGLAE